MVRMMRIEIWDSRAGTIETLTSYIIYVLKGGRNKVYGEPEQKDPEPRLGEHLCAYRGLRLAHTLQPLDQCSRALNRPLGEGMGGPHSSFTIF